IYIYAHFYTISISNYVYINQYIYLFLSMESDKSPPSVTEILPKKERVYDRDEPNPILCKPKLLPLRSVTLEKLEKIQQEAQDLMKKEEMLQ
ncbi:hypothetical protein Ahia01_001155500, partial [Argonauta hians]